MCYFAKGLLGRHGYENSGQSGDKSSPVDLPQEGISYEEEEGEEEEEEKEENCQ